MSFLELRNVSKAYGTGKAEVHALENIDLAVDRGALVAVMGPSGSGFAVADLVRLGETGRLRVCDAPGCEAVLIDLSRNRSRRYCDTGNCDNRQHVAAYHARHAT